MSSPIFPWFLLDGKLSNGCSTQYILCFFTGMDAIPPLGFDKAPGISFLHDPAARFPTSSTCDMELRLPTKHGSYMYIPFRDDMIVALMGNDGFGQL